MTITLTWHLMGMFFLTVLFIFWMNRQLTIHGEFGIMRVAPLFLFLVLLWSIYGGIVWW